MEKITVIIPAFNEESAIRDTIDSVIGCGKQYRVLVVDDGSKDNTFSIAKETGVEVLKLEKNMGKGNALNEGLKLVEQGIVVFLDGDVGRTSREITKLVEPILEGEADFTIGIFPPAKTKGGFGLVKGLAKYGIRLLTGNNVVASLSGQRAFRYEIIKDYKVAAGYGAEVGQTIDFLRRGFSLKEVEVEMGHRETKRDIRGFIHRGRQFVHILKVLMTKITERSTISDNNRGCF